MKRIVSLLVAVFVMVFSVVPVFAVDISDVDSEAFVDYLDSLSGVSTFAVRAADGIGPVFISGFSSSTSYTDTTKTISYRSGIYGNYRILDFSNYSTSYYSTNSLTSSGNGSQKTFYADFLKSVDYPGSDKNYYFYVADIETDVVSGKLSIPVSFSAPSSLSYTFTGSIKFLDSSGTQISSKSFSMVSGTGSYNNTLSVSFDWPEDTVYYVKIYLGNLVGAYSSSQSVTFSANNFTLSLTEPYTPETQPTDPPDSGGDSGDSGDDSGSSGTGGSIDTSGIEDRLESLPGQIVDGIGDELDKTNDKLESVDSSVKEGNNILTNLLEFVKGIPQTIIDGIVGLFIPSEEALMEYSGKWDTLLSERFGAIYQSIEVIQEYAAVFKLQESKTTIDFPEVTLDLAGVPFVFGGWTVQVIPNGFEFLVGSIKVITNFVALALFVNAMKNRLDRLFGGAS